MAWGFRGILRGLSERVLFHAVFERIPHGGDWIQEYPNTPKMSKQKRFRKAILPRVDD